MGKAKTTQKQIDELVSHLRSRIEILLNKWRGLCVDDPTLNSKASFTREEFNDQVPLLLQILFQRLGDNPMTEDPIIVANEHGLHRWQCGYSLPELITELEHLFSLILEEIDLYDATYAKLSAAALAVVHKKVFRIYAEANRGSIGYYNELRQTAAAEQANSLQNAFDGLEKLSKQRNEHLRHSSHDLRSSFGSLTIASQLLELPASEKDRKDLIRMVNANLTTIREMLLQLTDYARIEAGQEMLEIKKFDVAALIQATVESAQPLAQHRKLFLKGEGIEKLEISSDPVKIQRILQNLLHNALKYTQTGGIYVSWTQENDSRWILSVQDTGQGFPDHSPSALFAEQLKPAIQSPATREDVEVKKMPPDSEPFLRNKDNGLKESEGLGLFIVKKICELLKGTMDIESAPGQGTLVRLRLQSRQEPNKVW